MKTLKKVLALLLVLAMSLSLMSVAAFADGETFADESPAAEDVAAVEETTAEETSSESNVTNETTEAVSAEPETVEQAAEESPEEPAETADEVAEESTDEVEETIDEVEEPTEVETPEETAKTPAEEIVEELPAPVEQPVLTEEELAAQAEAERLAAEEAARLEAERLAAEEAARLEAERLAALERRWPKSDKELVFDTESYRVTVTVPESAFADHVYFRVIEMQWAELDEATAELLKASGLTEDDALLDIGFEDADGFEVEPDAAIGVSIEAAEAEIAEVYHVEDEETVAKVAEEVETVATFEVESFSIFVVKSGAVTEGYVYNENSQEFYTNVQAAINAATDGDTIQIRAGIYEPFDVWKQLNIKGTLDSNGNRLTTIKLNSDWTPSSSSIAELYPTAWKNHWNMGGNCAIYVAAQNVVVEDLIIDCSAAQNYAFSRGNEDNAINGGSSVNSSSSPMTFKNCYILGNGNATVTYAQYDFSLINNTIKDWASLDYQERGPHGVMTITGNTFENVGTLLQGLWSGVPTGVLTFANNSSNSASSIDLGSNAGSTDYPARISLGLNQSLRDWSRALVGTVDLDSSLGGNYLVTKSSQSDHDLYSVTPPVAKIGSTEYYTIADALLAAGYNDVVTALDLDSDSSLTKVADGFYQSGETYAASTDFYISSKAGLKYFADVVNGLGRPDTTVYAYVGKTVHLLTDATFESNEPWTPIGYHGGEGAIANPLVGGTGKRMFAGTFDGHNHTVSNLHFDDTTSGYLKSDAAGYDEYSVGFFGYIKAGNVLIKNLNIHNVEFATAGGSKFSKHCVGAVVGCVYNQATSTVQNCHVTGLIKLSGDWCVGGIAGLICSATNCTVNAENGSYIRGTYAGGLVGYGAYPNPATISGKVDKITVSEVEISSNYSSCAGSIVGYAKGDGVTLQNVTVGEQVIVKAAEKTIANKIGNSAAAIGDNEYYTLAAAVEAVADKGTITLLVSSISLADFVSAIGVKNLSVSGPHFFGTFALGKAISGTYDTNPSEYVATGYTAIRSDADGSYNATGSYWTVVPEYTVTWRVDGQDTTTTVAKGMTPVYTGIPTKTASGDTTYIFTGWSPALKAATADATYTAQFAENVAPVENGKVETKGEFASTGVEGEQQKVDTTVTTVTDESGTKTETFEQTTTTKKVEAAKFTVTVETTKVETKTVEGDTPNTQTTADTKTQTVELKSEAQNADTKVSGTVSSSTESAAKTNVTTAANKANNTIAAEKVDVAKIAEAELAKVDNAQERNVEIDISLTLQTTLDSYATVTNAETDAVTVSSMTYDVTPYMTTTVKVDGVAGTASEPVKVSNEVLAETVKTATEDAAKITFRLPVPDSFVEGKSVGDTLAVKHIHEDENGNVTSVEAITGKIGGEAGNYYVEIAVTEFSKFEVLPAGSAFYTVSFNSAGGSSVADQVIVSGSTAEQPTNPTRSGYSFNGWTLNGSAYDFASAVTSDITLVASWTQNSSRGSSRSSRSSSSGSTAPQTTTIVDETTPLSEFPIFYVDVADNSWYHDAIAYVTALELMNGVGDNHFAPDDSTTRGMVAVVMMRLASGEAVDLDSFFDVADSAYYAEAAAWAVKNGVFKGYDDGSFRGEINITREQFAAVLYRYALAKGYDVSAKADLGTYDDGTLVGGYASDAMAWAIANGVIKGVGNNRLDPLGNATRAQLATMLMRFDELTKDVV